MFGGQSISDYDLAMAIGVRKTFRKEFLKAIKEFLVFSDVENSTVEDILTELQDGKDKYHILDNTILPSYKNEENLPKVISILEKHNVNSSEHIMKKAYETACSRTEDETYQAMESVIFNFNSMHCLPASEKIWVLNTETDYVETISMEELAKNFTPTRYKAISIQRKNGRVEFKPITAIQKKDNHRKLITITDGFGNKVTTTDNHKIMFLNDAGRIDEETADKVPHVLIPTTMRYPKVKNDIYIGKYMSEQEENKSANDYSKTHIAVTEDFAKFIGYYTSIGKIINNDLIFKANHKVLNSTQLIELVKRLIDEDTSYTIDSLYQITFKLPETWSKMLIDKFGNKNKKISSEVLFSANECQAALVEAFIEDDDLINRDESLASQQVYLLLMTSIHEPSKQDIRLRKTFRAVKIQSKEESNSGDEYVYDISVADNETFLTKDVIFVHNSRAGSQVTFSSINFGTDTTPEGRLVIKDTLLAVEAGLGNKEIALFPITIFRIKKGINYYPEDPNYDLLRQSCKTSSLRMFPNYTYQDATYNLQYYDQNDYRTFISTINKSCGNKTVMFY